MAKQTINIGASPNDGTGTPLRTAFDYTNQNFTELYTATGPSGNNIVVPGSATITGDLTVDTNTLYVNSSTDRVSIGTLSALGSAKLSIAGKTQADTAVAGDVIGNFNNTSATGYGFRIGGGSATGGYALSVNNNAGSEFHQISGTGIATWSNVGGVAGTAMTLNATGLGVGGSPTAKLDVVGEIKGTNSGVSHSFSADANYGWMRSTGTNLGLLIGTTDAKSVNIVTGNTIRTTVDTSGNVGIGVTPSAWNTNYKGLVVGGSGGNGITIAGNDASIGTGYYLSGVGTYARDNGSATASSINMYNRAFVFRTAAAGAVNSAITWTDAMTLDASGNLLVGTTVSPTGTKIGSIAKLGGVSTEGTNYISVSTTPVALARAIGTGALFFVAGYNASGGAQGWWLVASTGASVPTVIASGNNTLLTVSFTQVSGILNMNTTSGTLSVTAFAITN